MTLFDCVPASRLGGKRYNLSVTVKEL